MNPFGSGDTGSGVVLCRHPGGTVQRIGDYRLVEKVAEGGMATVYRALQPSLERPVAVKVLSRELADDAGIVRRFNRESLIIARLTHPNIIQVIDRGIVDGMPYFVMNFVEGTDLARVIEQGGIVPDRRLDVIIQVCKALAYAHKNGVIHRDVKPANILLDTEGNAVVTDFGIAQFYSGGAATGDLTQAGTVMGTPRYMAPEQVLNAGAVTAASDLYALGVILYEWFTGTKPFGLFKPPRELDPDIDPRLEAIIIKCLETEPRDRFSSADELKDCLLELAQGAHIQTDRRDQALRGITTLKEKFALLDIIKESRAGSVYLFENRLDHRLLVIKKVIGSQHGLREARLLTTLRHPNIINVFGTSGTDRLFIVVMEYLTGGSLRDRMVKPWPWADSIRLLRSLCEALAFAHRNRIVHGNLRPSNVLFSDTGEPKLSDFGLDEHYGDDRSQRNWYRELDSNGGTLADVFALGVILHELLAGTVPEYRMGKLVLHERCERMPARVRALLEGMLGIEPTGRLRSVDAVLAELDVLVTRQSPRPAGVSPPRRGRVGWAAAAAGLLVIVVVAAYLLH